MNYILATLEEIECRLAHSPEGINGIWTGWSMPVKILATRTGPRIKNNVLIKPKKMFIQGGRDSFLKERWESVERLRLPVEFLKIEETEE